MNNMLKFSLLYLVNNSPNACSPTLHLLSLPILTKSFPKCTNLYTHPYPPLSLIYPPVLTPHPPQKKRKNRSCSLRFTIILVRVVTMSVLSCCTPLTSNHLSKGWTDIPSSWRMCSTHRSFLPQWKVESPI